VRSDTNPEREELTEISLAHVRTLRPMKHTPILYLTYPGAVDDRMALRARPLSLRIPLRPNVVGVLLGVRYCVISLQKPTADIP
jgi:hypothetical protein